MQLNKSSKETDGGEKDKQTVFCTTLLPAMAFLAPESELGVKERRAEKH